MSHDQKFAELRERHEQERAAEVRVTWRKVSWLTGGGWSGLCPLGALVYVEPAGAPGSGQSHYFFGRVGGKGRVYAGTRPSLSEAKCAAEALFINEAPAKAHERSTMTEKTIPTAESLMEGIGTVERPGKAPYARLRVLERRPNTSSEAPDDYRSLTLAYASPRKDGVVLGFATSAIAGAPARFQKALEARGSRSTMRVTARNVKGARALLEWLARQ